MTYIAITRYRKSTLLPVDRAAELICKQYECDSVSTNMEQIPYLIHDLINMEYCVVCYSLITDRIPDNIILSEN